MDDWKQHYTHGTIFIYPAEAVRKLVNSLREQYDSESHKICDAHITLTQPLLAEPNEKSFQLIESVLNTLKAFTIYYGPIETFGDSQTIKFDIQPKDAILTMRSALHQTGLFNLALPFTEGFIPHMTISEFGIGTTDAAKKFAAKLNQSIQPGIFQCNEIVYVKPNTSFHFEDVRKCRL